MPAYFVRIGDVRAVVQAADRDAALVKAITFYFSASGEEKFDPGEFIEILKEGDIEPRYATTEDTFDRLGIPYTVPGILADS